MGTTRSLDLTFRPAFPDEESRAKYVQGAGSAETVDGWFLALLTAVPERIVGTIRYGMGRMGDGRSSIDFRLTPGPGGELSGQEAAFLSSFTRFVTPDFRGRLRHLPLVSRDHAWDAAFLEAGFETSYREYHLSAPVAGLLARVEKSHAALQRYPSPLSEGQTVPVRGCDPAATIGLLTANGLMSGEEIRKIWETEDRQILDRDASCCFMLDGEMLGVVLAADAGKDLKIMAIAVREDVPGAKLWVTPHLMLHLFQASAARGYEQALFRANADTAPTTFNFAKRTGGATVVELRRWVKDILPNAG